MIGNNRDELLEQYDDAAFALLMNDYAEQEGTRLLQEFETVQPEMPAALDVRCSDLIHRTYEKQRRKARLKRTLRTMTRAVTVLFVAIGLCTTLVFSVDAIRIPVINFFIEQQDGFMVINGNRDGNRILLDHSILDSFIPEDYVLYNTTSSNNSPTVIYLNAEGSRILFSHYSLDSMTKIDTENATVEEITLAGYPGFFIKKGTIQKVIWYDDEHLLVYTLTASDLDFTTLWNLAEQIAQHYTNH